jgi:solute carrier family 8 (sodium/calcium exchanger)
MPLAELIDSPAHDRITKVIMKKSIHKAVAKSSPHGQTSCLESYHSVINQFAPKMLSYSYMGMLSR